MSMAHSLAFANLSTIQQPSSSSSSSSSSCYGSPHSCLLTPRRRVRIASSTSSNRLFIRRAMQPSRFHGGEPSKGVPKVTNSSGGPVPSGGPSLPIPNIPTWAKWALGSIVCLALPLCKKILRKEGGVEKAAETVVETVKKVAGVAVKVAADIADALPDGNKLKQEVIEVEQFTEKVEKGADKAEEFIHKIDEIKEEVDNLVEPFIEEGETIEKETQDKETKKNGSSTNL